MNRASIKKALRHILKFLNPFAIRVDAVIPVGKDCRPISYTVQAELRKEAYPLDWLNNFSLEQYLALSENNFENFFADYKDLTEEKIQANEIAPNTPHRIMIDATTNISCIHNFPITKTVEEFYPEFIEKIKQRNSRMVDRIQKSKRILFLSNRNENIEIFENFLKNMNSKYPNTNFIYLNIKNSEKKYCFKKQLSKNLTILEFGFNETLFNKPSEKWKGNQKEWNKITNKILLTN